MIYDPDFCFLSRCPGIGTKAVAKKSETRRRRYPLTPSSSSTPTSSTTL